MLAALILALLALSTLGAPVAHSDQPPALPRAPTCPDDQVLYWSTDSSEATCAPPPPLCKTGWYWCTSACTPYSAPCETATLTDRDLAAIQALAGREPPHRRQPNPGRNPRPGQEQGTPPNPTTPKNCAQGWSWCHGKCVPGKCTHAKPRLTGLDPPNGGRNLNAPGKRGLEARQATCADDEVLWWREGAPACGAPPPVCKSGWYWCESAKQCVTYWHKCEESAAPARRGHEGRSAEVPEPRPARKARIEE